ncbi:intraflagellar transport protein 88 homolog [Episyrphus balteatus]|uniref:intraflagellar transport protein 88 homolog n=1 Tax=Episyrphus balteatus TaxID=286459 RepID=UPI00248668E7|nr:intraflagellar transport protein 88 homolog [Episyrphus balteatus]
MNADPLVGDSKSTITNMSASDSAKRRSLLQTPMAAPPTGYTRPPTSSLFSRGNLVSSRLGGTTSLARPSTAVRAVGYTADSEKLIDQAFLQKAKQQQGLSANAVDSAAKEVNPLIRYRHLETKISGLLESSILLSAESSPNYAECLNKAKEAFSLDRTLHRLRDQYGENLFHNLELTYAVFFNLAEQYSNNDMYVEALNTYTMMIKNKMFPHVNHLKLNMGNIYFKMGIYTKAIKMYRMALDSVPSNHKQLRLKITQNIGILFIKMGQYSDAATSFEFVMSDRPDVRSGIHLVLCYFAMGDVEKIRNAFRSLVDIQIENEDDIKIQTFIEENEESKSVFEMLKTDEFAIYNKMKRNSVKKAITMVVDLISPVIEENYNDGYYWCIEIIKTSSNLSWLASDLELNKALVYLRQNDVNQAIETLRMYEKKDENMAANALTNLSFIYLHIGDMDNARLCTNQFLEMDRNNPSALVNSAVCDMKAGDFNNAKQKLENAIDDQPDMFEANYNLGLLAGKNMSGDDIDIAQEQFMKVREKIQHPHVHYQLARINEINNTSHSALDVYLHVLGTAGEMDSRLFEKFAGLYEKFSDYQEANQYYNEAYRLNPSDIGIATSIGSYYVKLQALDKGLYYYERSVLADPNDPNLMLRIAYCLRHLYMPKKYLEMFEKIYSKFPKNMICLKSLVHVTKSLGMLDLHEKYSSEYERLEKSAREMRQGSGRIGTARGKRNSASIRNSGDLKSSPMRHQQQQSQSQVSSINGTVYEGFVQHEDPLGPPAERPRTGMVRRRSSEDSGGDEDAELLLPI